MKEKLSNLLDKFLALSIREKIIILFTVFACLFFIDYSLVNHPLSLKNKHIKIDLLIKQQEYSALKQEQILLAAKANENPNEKVKKNIDSLKLRINSLDEEIKNSTGKLINPHDLEKLIKDLVSDNKAISLSSFEKYAPEKIVIDKETGAYLYKHGMSVKLTANFKAMQQYLAELEAISHKLIIEQFDYVVDKYPQANVHLQLHTMSSKSEFVYE